MVFAPVQNIAQNIPVGFLPQVGLMRFSARHDDPVKPAAQKVINPKVEVAEMLHAPSASGNLGKGIKPEMHWEVAGRGVEQFEELQLGVFKSRVGHIVNERDLEARGVEGSHRADGSFLCQARWNSASIHYDRHILPLKRMKGDNRESLFA